jgi:hypothetical protein
LIKPLNEEVRIFEFDRILGPSATQEESYNRIAYRVVNDVMEGYNGTIMAYGQTGSGKTYTIFGKKTSMDYSEEIHEDMGIVPRSIKHIFNSIREKSDSNTKFQVRVSFMQVYIEQIADLIQDESDVKELTNSPMVFNKNRKDNGMNGKEGLQIREDPKTGIFVKGLKQIKVNSEEELLELIKYGSKFRITSSTSMNKTSSRSHAILQVLVEQMWVEREKLSESAPEIKKRHYKKGLLTIVDLAGSERISKSGSEGLRLEEAKKINISVSSLGNVINALAVNTSMQHVPFRDSKLTRILTECLGGNSKTAICSNVSPFLMNHDETLTTLQFASRAIKIKVNAKVNEKIEMKKIKEKMNDFIKIKNIDSIIQENNKLDRETNELKQNYNNFRNELKNARGNKGKDRSTSRNRYSDGEDEENVTQNSYANHKRSKSANRGGPRPISSNRGVTEEENEKTPHNEYPNIVKKFHYMILHLQNELSKSTLQIFNLQEENKMLKEKLAKLSY